MTLSVDKPRNEEADDRLVETIDNVEPELGSSVLQSLDSSLVELREGEKSGGVHILIESSHDDDREGAAKKMRRDGDEFSSRRGEKKRRG